MKIKAGDRVISDKTIEDINGFWLKGTEFRVLSVGEKGYNLIDGFGDKIFNVDSSYFYKTI